MIIRAHRSLLQNDASKTLLRNTVEKYTQHQTQEPTFIDYEQQVDDIIRISYKERLESAVLAVKFICEVLRHQYDKAGLTELQAKNITAYVEHLEAVYEAKLSSEENKKDCAVCEKILIHFFDETMTVLQHETKLSKNDLIQHIRKADNFVNLLQPQKTIATVSLMPTNELGVTGHIIQIEKPLPPFDAKTAKEYCAIANSEGKSAQLPRWFIVMSPIGKAHFLEAMRKLKEKNDNRPLTADFVLANINNITSKEREIAGAANTRESILIIADQEMKEQEHHHMIRAANTGTRDVIDRGVRLDFAERNLIHMIKLSIESKLRDQKLTDTAKIRAKIIEYLQQAIIHQTLISPLPGLPDKRLKEDKEAAIQYLYTHGFKMDIEYAGVQYPITVPPKAFSNIIATNYPQNAARYLMPSNTSPLLINDAHVPIPPPSVIRNLADVILNRDLRQRELHHAALEEERANRRDLIIFSTCLSGKDREALKILCAQARYVYRYIYKKDFSFNHATNAEHKRFDRILHNLYMTWQQQIVAGQNAAGANGGKTPDRYLGKDMLRHFSHHDLATSETLADMNDFNVLLNKSTYNGHHLKTYDAFLDKRLTEPFLRHEAWIAKEEDTKKRWIIAGLVLATLLTGPIALAPLLFMLYRQHEATQNGAPAFTRPPSTQGLVRHSHFAVASCGLKKSIMIAAPTISCQV